MSGAANGPRTPVAGAPDGFDVLEQWERAGVFAQRPTGYQVLDQVERDPWFGLATGDLRALVERIARDPKLWQHHVHHDAEHRTYGQVIRTADVDVWGDLAPTAEALVDEAAGAAQAVTVQHGPGEAYDDAVALREWLEGAHPEVDVVLVGPVAGGPRWRIGVD